MKDEEATILAFTKKQIELEFPNGAMKSVNKENCSRKFKLKWVSDLRERFEFAVEFGDGTDIHNPSNPWTLQEDGDGFRIPIRLRDVAMISLKAPVWIHLSVATWLTPPAPIMSNLDINKFLNFESRDKYIF